MSLYRTEWGTRAKVAMVEQDLTLRDLSRMTGLTKEYCSSIITGGKNSIQAREKISAALGIPSEIESETAS